MNLADIFYRVRIGRINVALYPRCRATGAAMELCFCRMNDVISAMIAMGSMGSKKFVCCGTCMAVKMNAVRRGAMRFERLMALWMDVWSIPR